MVDVFSIILLSLLSLFLAVFLIKNIIDLVFKVKHHGYSRRDLEEFYTQFRQYVDTVVENQKDSQGDL